MHSVDTTAATPVLDDAPLVVGGITLASRLVVGTGKYATYAEMARCLDVSGTDCVTVAVRRERLVNAADDESLELY
jgi:thiazole synthase